MTISAIERRTASADGFADVVSPKRKVFEGAAAALIFGALGVLINLFQLGRASEWQWPVIADHFFDPDAVTFVGFKAARAEVMRYVWVYAPLVLVPLGVALLVVHFATRKAAAARVFADFQQRGWIAQQVISGLKVSNSAAFVDVAFITHPSIKDEDFDTAVRQYAGYLSTLSKKEMKALQVAARKQKVLGGVPATTLAPYMPPQAIAAAAVKRATFVAVIPPQTGGGKYTVLRVKA